MNNYKIVFIDIDGTLVDSKKQVSKKTKDILQKLVGQGTKIILTSGRPYKSIAIYAKECGLENIHIGSNGAIVADVSNDEVIQKNEIDKPTVLKILKLAQENNIFVMTTINGNQYIPFEKWGISPAYREYVKVEKNIESLVEDSKSNIIKLVLLDNNKAKLEKFKDMLMQYSITCVPIDFMTIPDEIRNANGKCENPYDLDVMAKNISKAKGIRCLLEYFNIKKEDSIGIGDGLNDLELFEAVGLKIAMKNAHENLKQSADIITEFDNNNSGVAEALAKIFNL